MSKNPYQIEDDLLVWAAIIFTILYSIKDNV